MKYSDIDRVNGEIKMLDLKGKNYAMVPERVTAFRKLYPEGFIQTEILHLSEDGTVVIMKATAGYYREDGSAVVLGSGMAKEVQGKGMVNGTSHIENCETSAVGRALGMIGLGLNGGGICSAEELVNAITAQNQMKQEKKLDLQPTANDFVPPVETAPAQVTTGGQVPEVNIRDNYLMEELKRMREARGVSVAENKRIFNEQLESLKAGRVVPDKDLREYTFEETVNMIQAMDKNFPIGA